MAPEIKEGKQYVGSQVDIFSSGVILFILIQGIFPFKEARKEEYFYSLLMQGKTLEYWDKVKGTALTKDCRELLEKIFSYDPSQRPTLNDLINHPWVQNQTLSDDECRQAILIRINEAKG